MEDFNPNKKDYHPEMHSAEHILNQTMVRMFNRGRSFSQHIEKKKSKCDYRFDRNLNPEEIAEIEKRVNDVIKQDMKVTEEFVTKEEAGKNCKSYKIARRCRRKGQNHSNWRL